MDTCDFKRYTAALIQLHEMIAHDQGDSDEADKIRDEMESLFHGASDEDRHLLDGLAGDLYMIHGKGMYVRTTDKEKVDKLRSLKQLIDKREWPQALETLRNDLGLREEEVAARRSEIWSNIDSKVADLFGRYAASYAMLRMLFEKAAGEWENATMFLSGGYRHLSWNPGRVAIISMGKGAVPFVLRRIADGCPWQWYDILVELVGGEHPTVPEEDRGRLDPVKKIYLEWAKTRGYFPDHGTPPKSTP